MRSGASVQGGTRLNRGSVSSHAPTPLKAIIRARWFLTLSPLRLEGKLARILSDARAWRVAGLVAMPALALVATNTAY